MRSFLFRPAIIIILFLYQNPITFAQSWMSGYSQRKEIIIDKSKVVATPLNIGTEIRKLDVLNFPVLIELTDKDLVHIPGSCSNKVLNIEGKDISFALKDSPDVPLSFQVEHYDPSAGKITCWVKIPVLSANGTSSAPSSIFLYYGGTALHDPYIAEGLNTWSAEYSRVWHMQRDIAPATSRNVQSNLPQENAIGSPGIDISNYVPARIGTGIWLNGTSQFLNSNAESSTTVTISAWIKPGSIGKEQIIVTNNTTGAFGTDGYQLKLNATGHLVLELFRGRAVVDATVGSVQLAADSWYFVAIGVSANEIILFMNGVKVQGRKISGPRLGPGGTITIGCSKQGNGNFDGIIDELRIQNVLRPIEWLQTEYINQNNPTGFYTVLAEEYNPVEFSRFTGAINDLWEEPANWNNGIVPSDNTKAIVSQKKVVRITGAGTQLLNRLILEQGAILSLNKHLDISCSTQIGTGASIKLDDNVRVKFGSDVLNDGDISLNQTTGTLIFSGSNPIQNFSGNGTTKVCRLENDQALAGNTLLLKASIEITGSVNAIKGILNSNHNLTLLSSATNAAAILPIENLNDAQISGAVNVHQQISGPYPSPATARGWRLLASPVYNMVEGLKYYDITAFKKSMFITGTGGVINGFDPSPLNGGTVYIHDQSLPGTLSQKYIAIGNTNTKISYGRGIYVFSRGDREAADSYASQVQTAPFSNPASYTIRHTGQVYQGELTVELSNKNTLSEGDGFNLLGNPYPSPIKWGNLIKTNLSPFVWLYDPLNNAYTVSDDAATIIPAGSGFFVRVNHGNTLGILTFTENSKYIDNNLIDHNPVLSSERFISRKQQTSAIPSQSNKAEVNRLTVFLSRDAFEQQYAIYFSANGKDEVDDNDALKIGEGYVSIAGVVNGNKLSIDQRPDLTERKEIKLYVSGWGTGSYTLNLDGVESFDKMESIILIDHYLNQRQKITAKESLYKFMINKDIPETQGSNRFTILFEPDIPDIISAKNIEILAYPNPFTDKLYLKTARPNDLKGAELIICNASGQIVNRQRINMPEHTIEINVIGLAKGIYLIKLYNRDANRIIKTLKVLKY